MMDFVDEFIMPLKCRHCGKAFRAEVDMSNDPWTAPAYCNKCKSKNIVRSLVVRRVEPARLYLGGNVI